MTVHAPQTQLATHTVENQPPEFAGGNLFHGDAALREAALREAGDWVEAPLSGIWEGSGNVIALDVLRTLARAPDAVAAYRAELAAARGGDARLDAAADALDATLNRAGEAEARAVAGRLVLLLQAALLVRHAPAPVAELFCATRLGAGGGSCYGTLPAGTVPDPVLTRIRLPGTD